MATPIGAQEVIAWTFTRPAAGTINKGDAVKNSADSVAQTAAIADIAVGAALNGATVGQAVAVQGGGIAIMTAKGAITTSDKLMPSAATAGAVSTSAGATAAQMGIALQTVNDGEKVAVLLAVPAVSRPTSV